MNKYFCDLIEYNVFKLLMYRSIIGYALPLYASIIAINEGDKEKQAYLDLNVNIHRGVYLYRHFSFLVLLIVFYFRFPLYQEIKLGLFVWLSLFKGADMLFEKVISPAFKKFEPQIETMASKIGNSFIQKITQSAYDFVAKLFGKPAADMAKAGLEAKKDEMEKDVAKKD